MTRHLFAKAARGLAGATAASALVLAAAPADAALPRAKTLPPIVGLLHCGYAGFDFPSPGQSVRFPVTQWAWDGLARPIAVRLVGVAPDTPSYGTWAIDTHGTTSRYDDEVTFTATAPPPTYAYTGVAYTVAAHGQRATCRIQSNAAQPPGGGG